MDDPSRSWTSRGEQGKCLGPLVESKGQEDEAKSAPASDTTVALSTQEYRPFKLVAREPASTMTTRFTFALPDGKRLVRRSLRRWWQRGLRWCNRAVCHASGPHHGPSTTSARGNKGRRACPTPVHARLRASAGEAAGSSAGDIGCVLTHCACVPQTDTFDLCIKVYESGRVSAAMGKLAVGRWKHDVARSEREDARSRSRAIATGDTVLMKGPIGRLKYSRGTVSIGGDAPRPVRRFNLLAGGSGITPMLQVCYNAPRLSRP